MAKCTKCGKQGLFLKLVNGLCPDCGISNHEKRKQVYKENEDIFSGYRWLSALSTSTCLPCGLLDGRVFKTIEEAEENTPNKICLNEHCRCILLPVISGMDYIEGSERAAEFGPVPANWTYETWLKNQNEKTQRKILGKYYDMFSNNTPLSNIVDLLQTKN